MAKAHARGGGLRTMNGVEWAHSGKDITVMFPRAGADATREALDEIASQTYGSELSEASCWSLSPSQPADLGAMVCARGFEWGWRPHWMALDLRSMPDAAGAPPGVRIEECDRFDLEGERIPYYNRAEAGWMNALAKAESSRLRHFVALIDGAMVGHSVVLVTEGSLGVAGIYNVGVRPDVQNRGIGSAVSLAPCRFARELGCNYATLNSAADFLYNKIGFASLGYGQSWWMHPAMMARPRPGPELIAFTEAIVRGGQADLDAISPGMIPASLDEPLPNGMTPMQLAVAAGRPKSASWLYRNGASMGLLQAWNVGWKSRARAMLRADPALANLRSGPWQITPMHSASWSGDVELARLLVSARPDMTAKDTEFQSTPLGWARHFNRQEIIELYSGQAESEPD